MTPQQNHDGTIEGRLAVLEAVARERVEQAAALETLLSYCRALDRGDKAAWVDCFTADGVFDVRSHLPEFPARRMAGRAELRAFVDGHTGPPEVHHKHVYLMPDVRVDGRTATATGYVIHLVNPEGRPLIQSYGRYEDVLARGDDGRWRIVERVAQIEGSVGSQR